MNNIEIQPPAVALTAGYWKATPIGDLWQMHTLQEVQDVLTIILTLVGIAVTVSLAVWQVTLYRKLQASEAAIRKKQDKIDAVEPDVNGRTSGQLVNEDQRQKMVAKERKPLLRELERLKEERDFIKDKLLFTKR